MLLVTNYTLRPNMSKSEVSRLMDIFGSRPRPAGEFAHYIRLDGRGGTILTETDNPDSLYGDVLAFNEFIQFEIIPVIKIDDALGPIASYLGG